ncbi:MAG: hypothetical protein N4A50_13780 [Vallitalea sp.]|jgi:hypothetical protein|nr:hypothetical protein [Vallitalea sp.]
METADNILLGFVTITEGLEKVFVDDKFVFVSDKEGNVLCTIYNNNEERELLEKYLEDNFISRDDISISVMDTLENQDLEEIFMDNRI